MFSRLRDRLKRNKTERKKSPFYDTGFHGDRHLLNFVNALMLKSDYFIETGANVGSTLAYVAQTYTDVQCLSCEPDKDAFDEAVKNTLGLSNVLVYNETSQDFIRRLQKDHKELFEKRCFFWLDAHGYGFKWPLKDELDFITSSFERGNILIDDFKVPGLECFKWDEYDGQICSFEFIKRALNAKHGYRVYYPAYTEKTSPHHPLTGWGLIEFGHEEGIEIPADLIGKVRKAL